MEFPSSLEVSKRSLLEHVYTKHLESRPWKCRDCGFATSYRANLFKHCASMGHTVSETRDLASELFENLNNNPVPLNVPTTVSENETESHKLAGDDSLELDATAGDSSDAAAVSDDAATVSDDAEASSPEIAGPLSASLIERETLKESISNTGRCHD
jgi:hypothetical protein